MPHASSPSIKVDYDEKRGRFLIECQFHMNHHIRGMPNRRWDAKNRIWSAPGIRANAVYLLEHVAKIPNLTIQNSPAALKAMAELALARPTHKPSTFPVWYGFKRPPRPKQREALDKTYGLHAVAFFMDMRTGKTKVEIDWNCAARIEDKIRAVILICPLSIRKNWVREIGKDATIPIDYHLLDTKDKGKAFRRWLHTPHDFKWLIVGVESLAAGSAIDYVKEFASCMPKVLCTVDESQNIKTHSATRSQKIVEVGRMCDWRHILTGTPLTKNPMDLFMQFEFLDPNIIGLGDYYSFRNRYAVMGGFDNKQIIGYSNLEELIELVAPYTFQVRQNEVIDASKTYVVREVQMTDAQKAVYQDLRKYSKIEGEGGNLQVQNVLEKMLRLQEIVGGHRSIEYTPEQIEEHIRTWGPAKKLARTYRQPIPGRNPKIEELLACAEEYEGSMIVWCAFIEEIQAVSTALRAKYGDDQVVEIYGAVDEAQRDINVNQLFQQRKARFCVGNTSTGGVGLTMDVADTIVYFSNTFNFGHREQSEERGTADGKSILIVDIVVPGTVDMTIMAANQEKKDVSEYVRGEIDRHREAQLFGD